MNAKVKTKPELAIRFLRQGLIPVYIKPKGFEEMSDAEKKEWANYILNSKDDKQLFEAMSDFENTDENGYFDSAPCVEAIERENGNLIVSTTAWDAFADPDYGENIVYENKNLAEFLHSLGYIKNDVSNIAMCNTPPKTLDNLKILDTAHAAALEKFRQEHGVKLVEKIKNDADAPQLVKDLIEENKITYIGFEKVTTSLEYMPDHCVYMYLSGESLIGVRTEDQSESFVECDYSYGDTDIEDADSLHFCIADLDLIDRDASRDEAVAALKYLLDIAETVEDEDRVVFRDYLLERED